MVRAITLFEGARSPIAATRGAVSLDAVSRWRDWRRVLSVPVPPNSQGFGRQRPGERVLVFGCVDDGGPRGPVLDAPMPSSATWIINA